MIERLMKNAEKGTNKIRIPKKFIAKFGSMFYMEIYNNKIVLVPLEHKKGE